jgi:hypothetical protein
MSEIIRWGERPREPLRSDIGTFVPVGTSRWLVPAATPPERTTESLTPFSCARSAGADEPAARPYQIKTLPIPPEEITAALPKNAENSPSSVEFRRLADAKMET